MVNSILEVGSHSMQTQNKILVGVLCILLLAIASGIFWFAFSSNVNQSVVRIGYLPIVGDLPVFVAQEFGYFKNEGLSIELIEFSSGNEATAALISGNTQVQSTLGVTTLLPLLEKSPGEVKVIFSAVEQEGTRSSGIVSKSGIKTIKDLKGKKIGTYSGTTQLQTLKMILDNYMNPNQDVSIIQVEPKLQVQALAAGQYDALFSIEPYITLALTQTNATLLEWNVRQKEITSPFWAAGTVVSKKFAQQRPKDVRKIIRALEKASIQIQNNEASTRNVLQKYTPLKEPITSHVGLYVWYPLSKEDRKAFTDLAIQLQQAQVTKTVVQAADVFYE